LLHALVTGYRYSCNRIQWPVHRLLQLQTVVLFINDLLSSSSSNLIFSSTTNPANITETKLPKQKYTHMDPHLSFLFFLG
ncbi:hypothetical protein VIGAN_08332200, partial [Vigna angularis var. angularis]